jgi:hypothetical protein
MSWLSKAFRSVWSWFATVWEGVAPKVRDDFEVFARRFADVALEEISKQALLTISGQQKLSDAADAVMKRAQAEGWVILRTAAITLVQSVYAAQKAKIGPLVAPPDDPETAQQIAERIQNPTPDR